MLLRYFLASLFGFLALSLYGLCFYGTDARMLLLCGGLGAGCALTYQVFENVIYPPAAIRMTFLSAFLVRLAFYGAFLGAAIGGLFFLDAYNLARVMWPLSDVWLDFQDWLGGGGLRQIMTYSAFMALVSQGIYSLIQIAGWQNLGYILRGTYRIPKYEQCLLVIIGPAMPSHGNVLSPSSMQLLKPLIAKHGLRISDYFNDSVLLSKSSQLHAEAGLVSFADECVQAFRDKKIPVRITLASGMVKLSEAGYTPRRIVTSGQAVDEALQLHRRSVAAGQYVLLSDKFYEPLTDELKGRFENSEVKEEHFWQRKPELVNLSLN